MIVLQHLSLTGPFGGLLTDSGDFFLRMACDVLAVGILIRVIYYRIYRRSDLFLTFFTLNFVIFCITYLLNQVQMSIGAAFGLFAVFSMLRYRTQGISAKDMTYLFVVISLGLISAVSQGGWLQLIVITGLILTGIQLLEGNFLFHREYSKTIIYDRIDLIRPEKRPILLADLQLRTGLPIHRIDIQNLDFIKDAVHLTIYYHQNNIRHVHTKTDESLAATSGADASVSNELMPAAAAD